MKMGCNSNDFFSGTKSRWGKDDRFMEPWMLTVTTVSYHNAHCSRIWNSWCDDTNDCNKTKRRWRRSTIVVAWGTGISATTLLEFYKSGSLIPYDIIHIDKVRCCGGRWFDRDMCMYVCMYVYVCMGQRHHHGRKEGRKDVREGRRRVRWKGMKGPRRDW